MQALKFIADHQAAIASNYAAIATLAQADSAANYDNIIWFRSDIAWREDAIKTIEEGMHPETGVWAEIAKTYAEIDATMERNGDTAYRAEYIAWLNKKIATMTKWAADHGIEAPADDAAIDAGADAAIDAGADAAIDAGADAAIDAGADAAIWDDIRWLRMEVIASRQWEASQPLSVVYEADPRSHRAGLLKRIASLTIDAAERGIRNPAADPESEDFTILVTRGDRPQITIRAANADEAKDLLSALTDGICWEHRSYHTDGNHHILEWSGPWGSNADAGIRHIVAYIDARQYLSYIVRW